MEIMLVGIAVLAAAVAAVVGLAMRSAYRDPVLVRCPYGRVDVQVRVGRTGLAEALGLPGLRCVDECALRQDRWFCRDACLATLGALPAPRA